MTDFATTIIGGRLGRDPETRPAGSGTVTTLNVAVTRRAPGTDRAKDVTTWWRVSVWNKGGEAAQKHLRKGDPVLCQGWPEMEEYTDANGVRRQSLRLRNATWQFMPSTKRDASAPAAEHATAPTGDADHAPAPAPTTTPPAAGDDEPPF